MTVNRGFRPQGLGEIAIRCRDMPAMVTIFRDVIGLELMAGGPFAEITFFLIADGVAGYMSVLTLFYHRRASRPEQPQWVVPGWQDPRFIIWPCLCPMPSKTPRCGGTIIWASLTASRSSLGWAGAGFSPKIARITQWNWWPIIRIFWILGLRKAARRLVFPARRGRPGRHSHHSQSR